MSAGAGRTGRSGPAGRRGRRPVPAAPFGAVPPGSSCVVPPPPRALPARRRPVRDPCCVRWGAGARTPGGPGVVDPADPRALGRRARRRSRLPDGTARCGADGGGSRRITSCGEAGPAEGEVHRREGPGGGRVRPGDAGTEPEAAVPLARGKSGGRSRRSRRGAGDGVQRLGAAGRLGRSTGFRPPRWKTVGRSGPGRTADAAR
jgi:hypothetical protein